MAVKTCGREAGLKCVVIDILDKNFVLIDGQVKRKRCNIDHLEPLKEKFKIKKNASHEEVIKELKNLNIEVKEKKSKTKKETPEQLKEKPKETKKEQKPKKLPKEQKTKKVKKKKSK